MRPTTFSTLALVLLLPLAACSPSGPTDSQPGAAASTAEAKDASETSLSGVSAAIQEKMREAQQELASKNIDVNGIRVGNNRRPDRHTRPKAEITPQGDLLIAGHPVAATPAQRTLLLGYRQQVIDIIKIGMDIGAQGADLGLNAAREALSAAFAGNTDKSVKAAIQPQVDRVRTTAAGLCQRLPGLLSAQQQLAAAMPEFRPYATMRQKDVDDCGKHKADKDGKPGFVVFSD
jgi:hypothetical protein